MSKEQTPIEELELRLNVMSSQEFIDWIRIEGLSKLKSSQDTKVLEALEREFSKLDGIDFSLIGGTEYYETEVKPKYE